VSDGNSTYTYSVCIEMCECRYACVLVVCACMVVESVRECVYLCTHAHTCMCVLHHLTGYFYSDEEAVRQDWQERRDVDD